ncbi:MAG: c-type cytochrome [Verrucomicrobia bacterium]|nr:c-type cytochrome [Verrucomicrobiota bacterium]
MPAWKLGGMRVETGNPSRGASRTPELLAQCLDLEEVEVEEARLLLRSFDFQKNSPVKEKALQKLAYNAWTKRSESGWMIGSEAFLRLKDSNLQTTPEFSQLLEALLDRVPRNSEFIKLVSTFSKENYYPEVIRIITSGSSRDLAVEGVRLLLNMEQDFLIEETLNKTSDEERAHLVSALGDSRDKRAISHLVQVLQNEGYKRSLRESAIRALGAYRDGAVALVTLARKNQFPEQFKPVAATALTQTTHVRAYEEAAQYFPIPKIRGEKALPGMTELLVYSGDAKRGREVFKETSCVACHQINGEGVNFGPDLSGIGGKLGKQGMYESIIDPNASVSESYQTATVELTNGSSNIGILVSETEQSILLRLPGGSDVRYDRSQVARVQTSEESLMPTGLQSLMTLDDLVNLVEYLISLR